MGISAPAEWRDIKRYKSGLRPKLPVSVGQPTTIRGIPSGSTPSVPRSVLIGSGLEMIADPYLRQNCHHLRSERLTSSPLISRSVCSHACT
jgi:hypothetical protein